MNTYKKHRGGGLLWLTSLLLGPRLASFTLPISILSIFIVFKLLRTLLPHGAKARLLLSMHYALFSIARGVGVPPTRKSSSWSPQPCSGACGKKAHAAGV